MVSNVVLKKWLTFYLTFFFFLGNVPPRSGGSSKYLRGHLFAAASTIAAAAGGSAGCGQSASAASVGSSAPTTSQRPNTSKVRVLSILDKIRSSTQENYPCNQRPSSMTTPAQTIQNEALIDAISLVEDNGYVNRSSRRKRGMVSDPLIIIPMNFAMATLGLKEYSHFLQT